MVNVGRRSKACFKCRDRRVKCDLQRPQCRRCVQGGQSCPGYPEAWDVVFRLQNDYAETKVQRRVQQARTARMQQAEIEATVPRSVSISPQTQSLSRFYHDYVTSSGISLFWILPWYRENNPTAAYFQDALQAVALLSFARQRHSPDLLIQARGHYGRSIVALNIALSNPSLTADDSVLLALFLLSLFELISADFLTGTSKDPRLECHIHLGGILLLLQWRAERGRQSSLDRSLFTFLSHISFFSMFLNNDPFDAKWTAIEEFADRWMNGHLLEPILHRTVEWKRKLRACMEACDRSPKTHEMKDLIKDGIILATDLETTATSVRYFPDRYNSSRQGQAAFNNMFEVRSEATGAIARCLYRTVRYHIIEQVCNFMTAFEQCGNAQFSPPDYAFGPSLKSTILDQVCDEIRAVLGLRTGRSMADNPPGMAYRAYCMFWPLVVLLFSPSAGDDIRAWARESLQLIGETSGLGLAAVAAGTISVGTSSKLAPKGEL
ncbi:hypothetical protein BJY00DRAFT_253676 [Aspergillus carlsbadensis]|nr:hypothetical protein BJY00DRAFT_253676 [Aspergillus carlsbadensis]